MHAKITELELVSAELWRAPECERLGSWLLRAAEGFTGRANSALPLGDPGLPLPIAVTAVTEWYRARGLPPMVVIPAALDSPGSESAGSGGDLDAYLESRGWTVRSGPAIVMTAPVSAVAASASLPVRARLDPVPDEAWCALYHYRGQDLPPIARTLLMSAPWQGFASIRDDDGTVSAIGRVAVAGDWASLTAVEVARSHRRRGLGAAITAALCRSAADRGARDVLLQVETGNAPARALYARLGFRPSHRYHYRVAPAALTGHRFGDLARQSEVLVHETEVVSPNKCGFSGRENIGLAYEDTLGIGFRRGNGGGWWPSRGVVAVPVARSSAFMAGVVAADSALRRSRTTKTLIGDVLESCQKWPGLSQARRVVEFSDERSESVLESCARVVFHEHGLPPPDLQAELGAERFAGRVDFYWRDFLTVAEADGEVKYSTSARAVSQLERDQALRAAGFRVVHFTWQQLFGEQLLVISWIRRAFRGELA